MGGGGVVVVRGGDCGGGLVQPGVGGAQMGLESEDGVRRVVVGVGGCGSGRRGCRGCGGDGGDLVVVVVSVVLESCRRSRVHGMGVRWDTLGEMAVLPDMSEPWNAERK